jgi:predicted ribosome quality control (RQC) complex YloA/Tae2 family protein
MSFDALTMAAIAAELEQTVLGGRVQRVVQTSRLSIGLEIYAGRQRHQLLASAHPLHARVHLSEVKPTRDPKARSPFLLHVRRRLRGARLKGIDVPALERILFLRFEHPKLPADEQENTFVIEIMGRRSNLILVDQETLVLDCIKRVTPQMSAARPMLPHQRYGLPPEQIKADPRGFDPQALARELAGLQPDTRLWQALVNLFRGVSPLLAREVVYRACGHSDVRVGEACAADRLTGELDGLWSLAVSGRWQPCLLLVEGRPVSYAPYPLTHTAEGEAPPVATISQTLDRFYASYEPLSGHRQTRQILLEAIGRQQERLRKRLSAVEDELARAGRAEELRRKGEWLLAYQNQVSPGQSLLSVEGMEITLDPKLTPVENAQAHFAAYKKAKQAGRTLPQRAEETRQGLAWLEEMAALVHLAETYDEIAFLGAELEEAGVHPVHPRVPRRRTSLPPRTFRSSDGFVILVGRNAHQNEQISLRRANRHDLWFHARDRPGAHVVVKTEGRPVPQKTLEEAASLAAHFSQGRDETRVTVNYTECRHLRRIGSTRPGLVRYDRERTLNVVPSPLPQNEIDDESTTS